MTVTLDPIWPWSQLFSGDGSGGSITDRLLSHWLLPLLLVVPMVLFLKAWRWFDFGASRRGTRVVLFLRLLAFLLAVLALLLPLLVAVPLELILVTALTYFRSEAPPRRVLAILALRLLAFLLAIAAILRPSLGFTDLHAQRGLLLVAVDGSESMTILDEMDSQSRWKYLVKLVKDSDASIEDLQDKQNVDVVFYRFADDTTLVQLDDFGKPNGKRTDIAGLLRSLYDQRDQRRLLGLLVLSDGADNGTRPPPALTEAVRWRNLPCPIHTFAFGNPNTSDRTRDIAVTGIQATPAPVPIKGLLTVRTRIDAPGFENSRVSVKLFFDDKEVNATFKQLTLTRGNEVELKTNAPDKPGEIKVTVRVGDLATGQPLPGEAIPTNNEISTYVTVSKEGLRVLLVDKPRDGEPQSISDALSRDARIRVTNVWLRGEETLDTDTAALLDCDKNPYDVIIIGDVTAKQLDAASRRAMPSIYRRVEDGGGFLMIGGYNSFGNGDWGTDPRAADIARLLPVDLKTHGQVPEGTEVRMVPTEAGRRLYMMRLTEGDDAAQDKAWENLNGRPLDGMALMGTPRNDSCVVLARADDKMKGPPLLVMQQYNKGRVLAFGGDTTWRWKRDAATAALQRRFWQRMVLWLARQDEAQGNVWVLPDARRLPIRSNLGFRVGMKSKTGAPILNGTYKVEVIDPDGKATPVTITRSDGEQRGTFTRTDTPGEYRIEVSGEGKDDNGGVVSDKAIVRFLVYDEDVEMQHRAADHDFLHKLASAGGGKFHQADELPGFLRDLRNDPDSGVRAHLNLYPNWRTTTRSPFLGFFFVLFVMVVGGEWLLRRRWGMV